MVILTPPVSSGARHACSLPSLMAGDGAEQASSRCMGDDATMGESCIEVGRIDMIDTTPAALAIAEQISADDARAIICEAYYGRAAEIAAGLELPSSDGDAMMADFSEGVDTTPPALAIAEQISAADGQDAIYANYHERALQLEKEERDAKDEFMSMLAARGGN